MGKRIAAAGMLKIRKGQLRSLSPLRYKLAFFFTAICCFVNLKADTSIPVVITALTLLIFVLSTIPSKNGE